MTSVFQFVARHAESLLRIRRRVCSDNHPKPSQSRKFACTVYRSKEASGQLVQLDMVVGEATQYLRKGSTPATPSGKQFTPKKRNADGTEAGTITIDQKSFIIFFRSQNLLPQVLWFTSLRRPRIGFHLASPKSRNMWLTRTLRIPLRQQIYADRLLEAFSNLLSPPYWDDLDVDAMFPKITEAVLLI